eukprot:1048378-Pelagomonas_calceolata.AAC.2
MQQDLVSHHVASSLLVEKRRDGRRGLHSCTCLLGQLSRRLPPCKLKAKGRVGNKVDTQMVAAMHPMEGRAGNKVDTQK